MPAPPFPGAKKVFYIKLESIKFLHVNNVRSVRFVINVRS